MSLPRLWVGEPLAPVRRNGEQGGGAVTRPQVGQKWPDREPLERQKRHQQGQFHFYTNADWLLETIEKSFPLIFGETPEKESQQAEQSAGSRQCWGHYTSRLRCH